MNTVTSILTFSCAENFFFAVGFSRQPLPKGKHFASATNDAGPGITATDATSCQGCELAILRPETLAAPLAKLRPTANLFRSAIRGDRLCHRSQAELLRVGLKKQITNTNGVKRKRPDPEYLGLVSVRTTTPHKGRHDAVVRLAGD